MGDPFGRREQRIQLGGLTSNQEEPVQVAAMRVEKHDIESVNRTTSFSSNQVTTLIRERKSLT